MQEDFAAEHGFGGHQRAEQLLQPEVDHGMADGRIDETFEPPQFLGQRFDQSGLRALVETLGVAVQSAVGATDCGECGAHVVQLLLAAITLTGDLVLAGLQVDRQAEQVAVLVTEDRDQAFAGTGQRRACGHERQRSGGEHPGSRRVDRQHA